MASYSGQMQGSSIERCFGVYVRLICQQQLNYLDMALIAGEMQTGVIIQSSVNYQSQFTWHSNRLDIKFFLYLINRGV